MKKGLTITLLTVALAMFGFQAMAMAPVITDIKSPIVGTNDVTAPNTFVYEDAIDLTAYVSDDTSDSAEVLWSYEESGSKYILNGVDPISGSDPAGIEVTPGAKEIGHQVLNGELDLDSNPATITVRNKDLSPLGGSTTIPGTTGIIAAQTGTITLWASDGSTHSLPKDLVIYTDNGGKDRMSPDTGDPVKVYDPDFPGTGANAFTFASLFGTVTQTSSGGKICLETPALGDNWGIWVGPANALELTQNSVYNITLSMSSSNTAPGNTPFWDMALDNNNNAGTLANLYGADAYFLDNENGANSAVAAGKTFHMIWTPLAVATAQFNGTGAFASAETIFSPANAAQKDGRFILRVMDLWQGGASGFRADIQYGTVCIGDLVVTKTPLADVKVVTAGLMDVSTFAISTGSGVGNIAVRDLAPGCATMTIVGGAIQIIPTTAGQTTAYQQLFPGDTDNNFSVPSTQADNYPVAYDVQSIYRIQYEVAAIDANGEANPPDALWITADTPTNEVIYNSYVTSSIGGTAMPKTGTPQIYTAFYHTNYGTDSTIGAPWKRMRPYFIWANLSDLGGTGNDNSGGFKIPRCKVDKVTLQ